MSIWTKLFGARRPAVVDAAAITAEAKDGMQNVVTMMGTPRDKRTAGIYARPTELRQTDLDYMYGGSWLAGKIIDIPVDDMTRMGWARKWDGYDKDQDSVKKVQDAEEHFGIYAKVNSQAKWGRLYSEAYLVPVIRGQRLE